MDELEVFIVQDSKDKIEMDFATREDLGGVVSSLRAIDKRG